MFMYAADVVARSISGSWVLACVGCVGSSATPSAGVESAAAEAAESAAAEAADSSECDGDRPPALRAYDAIAPDLRFSLVLTRDARGVWTPADRLDMPLHHASTIAWTDDAQLLASARVDRVLVVATGLGRVSLEHDERRNTWFATYGARVERVCARWAG
jgi:hypothetical protein